MAEGSGEDEKPYVFRNQSRKNKRKSFGPNYNNEENNVRPDLGLGNTQTSEEKLVTDNHGSGNHFTNSG
jgi:hypothetical protein